jgi:hypothetical protein
MGARHWEFVVDEPLMGFLATHKRSWTPEAKRYVSFKGRVRLLATIAGVPNALARDSRATITLLVMWKKKARVDTVNVYKAIEDGCFQKDRRVLSGVFDANEHTGKESAVVSVTIEGEADGKGASLPVLRR